MQRASIRLATQATRSSSVRNLSTSSTREALAKYTFPAMSPTMTEGGIASWKKKEGDTFAAGDVLLEIETDKATMDVESTEDGILAKIIVQDGAKGLPVGSLIAIVAEEGDDLSGADALAAEGSDAAEGIPKSDSQKAEADAKSSSSNPSPADSPAKAEEPQPSVASSGPLATPAPLTAVGTPETPAKAPTHPSKVGPSGSHVFATPSARRLAIEKGVPLGEVKGTGPAGRILQTDVEKFKGGAAAAAPAKSSGGAASSSAAAAEYEDKPVSSMRKTIGKRLLESTQSIPSFYVTVEVNMDRLIKLREMFNSAGSEGKVKLSVNDFIVKAASLALADVPEANSAWMGDVIRQYKKADICVAVATPTGLITPIIKDVGAKGLATISAETKSLATKARDGKLKPEEYQGGSFTISNLGMFGVSDFTAIINPPQSCILAVGAAFPKVVAVSPASSGGGFKTTQVMNVTMTSDHRTVDGAVAARFLKAFKGYMEQPLTFML